MNKRLIPAFACVVCRGARRACDLSRLATGAWFVAALKKDSPRRGGMVETRSTVLLQRHADAEPGWLDRSAILVDLNS
jgi:hypothetical protein